LQIEVKDLTLEVNGRELLSHADLKLKDAIHYVLVGRNGTGKSTLLKAIAEERIPGIAVNLHCLLLGQTLVHNLDHGHRGKLSALEYGKLLLYGEVMGHGA